MEEKLITIETAELAKLAGFNIPVDGRYYWDPEYLKTVLSKKGAVKCDNSDSISAPTQSLLHGWLRHLSTPIIVTPTTDFVVWEVQIQHPDKGIFIIDKNSEDRWFNSYEEAMEAGLIKALKLI